MREAGHILGQEITAFVAEHVRSLLTGDILMFFHRNPEAVLDLEGLASRLGRRPEEVGAEVEALCGSGILTCSGGLIRYRPSARDRHEIAAFAECAFDRAARPALLAVILGSFNPENGRVRPT